MQLELHFAKPVGDILAVDAPDVDGPFVRVVWVEARWASGGVKELGCRTEDEGAVDGDALHAVRFGGVDSGVGVCG